MDDVFSYKIHKSAGETLLAIADNELVGKRFSDGKRELVLSREFYGDRAAHTSAILMLVRSSTTVNAIGKRTVELLIENGIVKKNEIIEVCGLPHAQIFCV